ncbi:hypothetical protein P154DRAFT_581608 [Amniculicola lignicola CBS 123094]|uniref:Uncharacterized protein n=1 Tax=Amniculicola lignicola CBS 123094 TaxID=1392246 RepID=A0A6A5W3G0_9PLEO|nr:hypothetical protein P154DRAFT_581608 [Amniculicola lignicola CBS 123094]
MTTFGKHSQFECAVESKVKLMAMIEHFQVGPLTVKGATKADPIIDIELSTDKQIVQAEVDEELEEGLRLEAQFKGDINIKDLMSWANAGFEIYALVGPHLINHITGQVEQQINAAQEAVKKAETDASFEAAHAGSHTHSKRVTRQERGIEGARHDIENEQRRVDGLDRDIDWINCRIDDEPWYNCPPLISEKAGMAAAQAIATASLQAMRGILYAAEGVVHGTGFIAAEGVIGASDLALEGIRVLKTEALNAAQSGLDEISNNEDGVIRMAIDALHAAETARNELHVFSFAKDALQSGEDMAQGIIGGAQGAMDALSSCGDFIAFDAAEAALKFAKDNTSELNLARHAVEVAEGAADLAPDIGKWAVQHAGQIFNIRKVEFSGLVRSLVHADEGGPPLRVNIEGTVFGEGFEIHIVWKPDFDLVKLIKEVFTMLWQKIQELVKAIEL